MLQGSSMDFHEWNNALTDHQREESFGGAPHGEKTSFKDEWRLKLKEAEDIIENSAADLLEALEAENSWDFKSAASDLTKYEKSCVWARFTDVQKEKIASLMHMEDNNG